MLNDTNFYYHERLTHLQSATMIVLIVADKNVVGPTFTVCTVYLYPPAANLSAMVVFETDNHNDVIMWSSFRLQLLR